MAEAIESLVVGAGVIGLAVAHKLAKAGHEILVIDQASAIGSETSSRNSEVIHAGIYYPPGTLKAKLCVEGRRQLYDFCRERVIEARQLGKLIVAVTEAEIPKLKSIAENAGRNGVTGLNWMTESEVSRLEPAVRCKAALYSPSTGILDSHAFMLSLQGELESHGHSVALRTTFVSASKTGNGFEVHLADEEGEEFALSCRNLINCAGHGAHAVARAVAGVDVANLPPQFFAKGNYCTVSGQSPFKHLIYPVPAAGALGIHVTLDLDSRVRLGPDIEWISGVDYTVKDEIVHRFREACLSYWPGIAMRELSPSHCGIRPKIHGPASSFADFAIQGHEHHGIVGLVNLFGIESPGLTSSLAVGSYVERLLAVRSGTGS